MARTLVAVVGSVLAAAGSLAGIVAGQVVAGARGVAVAAALLLLAGALHRRRTANRRWFSVGIAVGTVGPAFFVILIDIALSGMP
ncbi:MAG: hypothetical protein JWM89_1500 [Acidimicrobiales bacterium]|nr:hypothetical protein [Acidimicrobiales bacterium]